MGDEEDSTSETRCYLCFAPNDDSGDCAEEGKHTSQAQDAEALRDSQLDAQRG